MTKDETSKYTILLKDEKAWQFVFPMEVKSLITRPAPGLTLKGPGFYEISGLAWSGNGSIRQVDVSADGGKSWAPAALQGPILPKAPVRFRAPWQWNGGPAVLQSRATDDTGMVQPTRAQFAAERGLRGVYHYNAIASWAHRREGGGEQCLCLSTSPSASRLLVALRRAGAGAAIRAADRARRHRAVGHQHRSGRRRPSARPRHRRAGRSDLRREVPGLSWRERQPANPTMRWSAAWARSRPDKVPMKTVGSFWPYATTLFDYVRRAMPFQESQSLTSDELYAVSAYILHLNGIVGPNDVLDAQSLPKVRMPNRDGFIPFPRNPK